MTGEAASPADPFDTAGLRRTVLAAWAASPARFREDANAEDELVRGGYRDRVVVELIQNAADAAGSLGQRGRVLLDLRADRLLVANTGAEIDQGAVAALSSLRASTKRGAGTVGRFGVGFAAVLAVTDEPTILSGRGGVTWSRRRARDTAAGVESLADELRRRGDAVPVLRLPFPVEAADGSEPCPPAGYDTAVVAPLRDAAAVDLVRDLLTGIDDAIMLAFDDVAQIRVVINGDERVLAAGSPRPLVGHGADAGRDTVITVRPVNENRWAVAVRDGLADPDLLADRPHEERSRRYWEAQVAVLVDGADRPLSPLATGSGGDLASVIHAPTPTDDRTDLPALVMATFPIDSARRRLAPGALTDLLIAELGVAFADLLVALGTPDVLDLVPLPLGAGEFDTALHQVILDTLASTPVVPTARGDRIPPRDVVLIDGLDGRATQDILGEIIVGLPAREWWRPDVLRRLGATIRPLADVVDDLAGVNLDAARWRRVYDSLAQIAVTTELGALPVPLVDGRVIRGPRGVVLAADVEASALVALGLRVVDPAAAHPLLRRLGAVEATPASIVRDPAVRAAVENADLDQPDSARDLTAAVLALIAAAGIDVTEEPWLAAVSVETEAGDLAPAGEVWLADAPVLAVLDVDPDADVVATSVVDLHGRDVLSAIGVATGFRVVRETDATIDDDFWHDLDAEDDYVAFVLDRLPEQDVPPVIAEYVAVADLDLVRAESWPEALRLIAADPATRAAVVDPAFVVDFAGKRHRFPSYTAWWLRTHARIGGHRLPELRVADVDDPVVAALFPPAGVEVDDGVGAALGVVRSLDDAAPSVVVDLLADPDVVLSAAQLAATYAWLTTADPHDVAPPARIRVPDGSGTRIVNSADVVVADGPYWLPVLADHGAVLAGPPALADILDVASASEEVDVAVPAGRTASVPDVVATVLPETPAEYVEHDDLNIGGVDVAWWVDDDDTVHAATTDGLAAGLAWTTGRWERRWIVAAALADPSSIDLLVAEESFTRQH